MQEPSDLTRLINQMGEGDEEARRIVLDRLYPEFLRIARSVRRWPTGQPGATQTTDLVHDAILRLAPLRRRWKNHGHFLATFCRAVRSVRVDRERERSRREGRTSSLEDEWDPRVEAADGLQLDVLQLEHHLRTLDAKDPQAADVVTMHFFGQLTFEVIAADTGLSPKQVRGLWGAARQWLQRKIEGEDRE